MSGEENQQEFAGKSKGLGQVCRHTYVEARRQDRPQGLPAANQLAPFVSGLLLVAEQCVPSKAIFSATLSAALEQFCCVFRI
jgi:hypothetical protein